MSADLVLTGGRIHTMEDSPPMAEAMAIRDGRILATGRTEDIADLAGPGSRVIDLAGHTVIPGLIDAHLHLLSFGLGLNRVDLQGISSVDEALSRVRTAAERATLDEWVQGAGWDRNLFGRLPTRQELDSVAPNNPVLLSSKDLHSLWVNSLALKKAGIDHSTPTPPDGDVVRDAATGEPIGVLREGARKPLFDAVPPPSSERCEEALRQALDVAASHGLTGLQTFEGVEAFRALQALRGRGALKLRVCCHLWPDGFLDASHLGLRAGFGDEWLRLGHLKLFLDGALGSQTAHMLEPYSESSGLGIATMSREELRSLVLEAAAADIPVAVHAIGDAANRAALDILEETRPVWSHRNLRPRIEHVQLLHRADAHRLGTIGVIASMQPIHATSDWKVANRHWAGRTDFAYAWRTVLDSGATLAFGSDCPVETIDPMGGMHAAVTRQTADGLPTGGWHPEQCISPLEALRAYTLGAAYASGEEAIKGSLAPGKLADFAVLSEDPFGGPPDRLLSTHIRATVVAGRLVYGDWP